MRLMQPSHDLASADENRCSLTPRTTHTFSCIFPITLHLNESGYCSSEVICPSPWHCYQRVTSSSSCWRSDKITCLHSRCNCPFIVVCEKQTCYSTILPPRWGHDPSLPGRMTTLGRRLPRNGRCIELRSPTAP